MSSVDGIGLTQSEKENLFDELVSQMERLDAQAIVVRTNTQAINAIGIDNWFEENFNYCKYPLKTQCNSIFSDQFLEGKLSCANLNLSVMPLKIMMIPIL